MAISPVDGRIYFGQDSAAPASFWTWRPSSGLSTIVTGEAYPGDSSTVIDTNGRVFFGSRNGNPQSFWTWHPGVTGNTTVPRVSATGNKTNQSLAVTLPAGILNYNTSTQDAAGEFYLSDATAYTIDRFTYKASSGAFERKTQFAWNASTGAVGAIAIDQAKPGIALLDTANKQIDYYSNRQATGTPAAAFQYSVSAATTPTGLAVSGRTGNYLVIDSSLQGSTPDKYARLFVFDESGNQKTGSPYKIYVDDNPTAPNPALSFDLTAETDFKIQYDDEKNVLYLIAPNVGYVVALSLPEYL